MKDLNPKVRHSKAQLQLLDQVEGKHRIKPISVTLLLAIGSTLLEGAIAFHLLKTIDPLLAKLGALFPVMMLWGLAHLQATYVNLPNHYDALKEEYQHELDR